jgi:hypothetical protein
MDCLSSEVRLNVEMDVVMTVIANGCYRWLSKLLKGCEKMEPKQLYRKFIETGGHVRVRGNDLIVSFDPSSTPRFCNSFLRLWLRAGELLLALHFHLFAKNFRPSLSRMQRAYYRA